MTEDQAYAVVGGRGSMTVFEIYIKTTPEELWAAIVDPELSLADYQALGDRLARRI